MRTDVLGVGFDDLTLAEAVGRAEELLSKEGPCLVATPNPEIVQLAAKDPDYARILAGASLVLPDGVGILYAARILGRPLKGRVPGIEFAGALMERLAKTGHRLFLLGAKPGVAEAARARLGERYPGLVICGVHDGYFQEDGPVAEEIRRSAADVVFVCLGAPKQEKWIAKNGAGTGAKLLIGLGGCLDVFSGNVKRSPEGFRKLGLEWLYRLLKEPARARRMAKLPLFLVEAARRSFLERK